ncbi:MAG: hypothetical protein E7407_02650 [Ruminococcaceae bacterium]|nr:hypothetical protein [Oscillospiraceae bacterium]
MKNILKKIADKLQFVFGYGILLCLFAGGITFFGYLAAFIIGGETAAVICEFIYKMFFPIVIKASTVLVLVGLVIMYLRGEKSLDVGNNKK